MLQPDAADFHISEKVEIAAGALLALVDMLQACTKGLARKKPTQKGGRPRKYGTN